MECLNLSIKFLFNTYFHTKTKLRLVFTRVTVLFIICNYHAYSCLALIISFDNHAFASVGHIIWSLLLDSLPSVLWRCWLGGRKGIRPEKKLEWRGAGVVICLERDADLHMASVKSRLVLPFWYRLTWVVLEKRAVKRVCVLLLDSLCSFVRSQNPFCGVSILLMGSWCVLDCFDWVFEFLYCPTVCHLSLVVFFHSDWREKPRGTG